MKVTKRERRLDRAWTLRGIAMELEGHLANGSEFLFTGRNGDDVSKARRKMSEARRGVKKSPEHAKKVSENSTRTKRQRRFFRVLFNSIVSRHVICEKSAP